MHQNLNKNHLGEAALIVGLGLFGFSLSADEVDVYLLSGQSNMQGIGLVENLPEDWQQPVKGAFFWNGKSFETLDPKQTKISTRAGEFGPEIGLARALKAADSCREIYLIKFYRSGQPLDPGWNGYQWMGDPAGAGRANFYPGLGPEDSNKGRHYLDMMRMYHETLSHLKSEGKTPVIRGMAWMQGEQDSKHAVSAGRYAHNLRRLRNRIQEDLGAEPFPLVFGQVLPYTPAMERFTHRVEIREQMRRLDERVGCLGSEPGIRMVSTDGLGLKPDTVHYDASGLKELGWRFGMTLVDMRDGFTQRR